MRLPMNFLKNMSHKQNDIVCEEVNEIRLEKGLEPVTLSEAIELWLDEKVLTSEELSVNYVL